MSAIHFMVTTQHFIKGQMRLKCTASIFDIFREEIESVIEEDRPRIMASGRSYDAHSYPHDDNSVGYEDHNESYLTYFSAPKSSASPRAKAPFAIIFEYFHKLLPALSLRKIKNHICNTLATFIIDIERYYGKITQNVMTTYWLKMEQELIKLITVMAVLLKIYQQQQEQNNNGGNGKTCHWWRQMLGNGSNVLGKIFCSFKKQQEQQLMKSTTIMNEYEDMHQEQREPLLVQQTKPNKAHSYLCTQQRGEGGEEATTIDILLAALRSDCQLENEQCLAANQNVINEKVFWHTATATGAGALESFSNVDYQQHWRQRQRQQQQQMSQTLDNVPSTNATTSLAFPLQGLPFATIAIVVGTGAGVTFGRDSFPLCEDVDDAAGGGDADDDAFVATKSNNANYMSRDQTLLMMTSSKKSATTYLNSRKLQRVAAKLAMQWLEEIEEEPSRPSPPAAAVTTGALERNLKSMAHKGNAKAAPSSTSSVSFLTFALPSLYLKKAFSFSPLPQFHNSYLMTFIGKFLLHQC
uniref:Uncharacterized protein n=1 Tax=Musca domestica TaxID=7370 RepID=A0A1I8MV35_MUSDO